MTRSIRGNEMSNLLRGYLQTEEARGFKATFDEMLEEDRHIFAKDATRRHARNSSEAFHWWESLRARLDDPVKQLVLEEILARNGLTVEEIYHCLPEEIDDQSLLTARDKAISLITGKAGSGRKVSESGEDLQKSLTLARQRLAVDSAGDAARAWWAEQERVTQSDPAILLSLAEDIISRNATLDDFQRARIESFTDNVGAILNYLDYLSNSRGTNRESGDDFWLRIPAPGRTRTSDWSDERIHKRLAVLTKQVQLDTATDSAREWWRGIEAARTTQPSLLLRFFEELAVRHANIDQLHRAAMLAKTTNLRAVLAYFDYLEMRSPIVVSTYEFTTVTLDTNGNTIERRQLTASRFIEKIAPGIEIEMVEVPAGSFLMGTSKSEEARYLNEYVKRGIDVKQATEWINDEQPQHLVEVSSFSIGRYPVTQEQWEVVAGWSMVKMELNPKPSRFRGAKRPVENINWYEATEFCQRLSLRTGREYRLPSESEWEYACRAGTATPFTFGETITTDIVNYDGNRPFGGAPVGLYRRETTDVGSLEIENAFGISEMHGNVWEWCADLYTQYQKATGEEPTSSTSRVVRGGSWNYYSNVCRSAFRYWFRPDVRDLNIGLRVVVGARTSLHSAL